MACFFPRLAESGSFETFADVFAAFGEEEFGCAVVAVGVRVPADEEDF